MKHIITFRVKDEVPLYFQDLVSGDMFYVGDDFDTLYLKLNEIQIHTNKENLGYFNAVTVDCGCLTFVPPLAQVSKIIHPLNFYDTDLISTRPREYKLCKEKQ